MSKNSKIYQLKVADPLKMFENYYIQIFRNTCKENSDFLKLKASKFFRCLCPNFITPIFLFFKIDII